MKSGGNQTGADQILKAKEKSLATDSDHHILKAKRSKFTTFGFSERNGELKSDNCWLRSVRGFERYKRGQEPKFKLKQKRNQRSAKCRVECKYASRDN